MEYKPTDMERRAKLERYVQGLLSPHLLILRYIRQHLQPCGAVDTHVTLSIFRLVMESLATSKETRHTAPRVYLTAVSIPLPEKAGCN